MSAEKYYISFLDKIRKLRRREITLLSFTNLSGFIITFGLVFLCSVLLESTLRFPSDKRILLSLFLLLSGIGLLLYYLFPSVKAISGRDRRFDLEILCTNVGSKFPEIHDKLLNAVQLFSTLSANKNLYSPALIRNTMEKTGASFKDYDFNRSIDYTDFKKRIYIFSIFVLGIFTPLLINPSGTGSAIERLMNPLKEYPVPAAFSMEISPGDTEIIRNEPFDLKVRLTGQTPDILSVFIKAKNSSKYYEYFVEKIKTENSADSETGSGEANYSYRIDNAKESFSYFVRGRENGSFLTGRNIDSPLYYVDVIHRPMVRKLITHLDYPAYSLLASRYLDDNIGDISALKGTKAKLDISLNKAVGSAVLRFDSGLEVPVKFTGNTGTAEFPILMNDLYEIDLADKSGIKNSEPIEYRISVIEDSSPFIQIVSPGRDTDIGEDREMIVALKVSDDFGLTNLRLGFRLIDRDEVETVLSPENKERLLLDPSAFRYIDIPFENKNGVMQDILALWDLNDVQMFPEDQVLYFAEVFDNDAVSGPKRTRSRVFTVRLPSIEELFAMAAEAQEMEEKRLSEVLDEGKKLNEELKEIANKMLQESELEWEEKQKTEEAIETQQEIQKKIEDISKELNKIVEKFEDNDVLSAEVLDKYKELQDMLRELNSPEMQEAMKKLQEAMNNAKDKKKNRQNLNNFRNAQEAFLQRVERTLNILKRLQVEQMMDELVTKAEKLNETQELINSETDSLNNMSREETETGPEGAREIENSAQRLSKQEEDLSGRFDNLKETLDRMLNKMNEIPDISSEKLKNIEQDLADSQLLRKIQKMSGELGQKEFQKSAATGREIKEELQNIENDLKEARKELSENQKQKILADMRNAAGSLLELSKKEETLKTESQRLTANSDKYTSIGDNQMNIKSGLMRTIGKLVRLSEKTFFLTPELGKELGNSSRSMQSSINSLEQRNGQNVLKHQQAAMGSLNKAILSLNESIRNAQQSGSGMGFDEFLQQMEKLSGRQQGINQNTLDLLQGSGERTLEQQAAMQRLAQQQEMMRKSLEELQEEMKGMGSLQDRLGQMSGDMGEVKKQLEDLNADERTLRLQERILSRMLDSQKSVNKRDFSKKRQAEQAKQYRAISPGDLPENLGENPQFLQETLIKALKEGYSKDFEDLIIKYFEELSKKSSLKKEGGGY